MCGIFCSIIYNQNTFLNEISKRGPLSECNPLFLACQHNFLRRGPDSFHEINVDISECTLLQIAGCVLWTQGDCVVRQPLIDNDGNILMWNGDIFAGSLANDGNDTEALSARLLQITRDNGDVAALFECIRGPYSFMYYHKEEKKLYFGRDVIGRHSLILQWDQRNVCICSVSHRLYTTACEVPAVGIFYFDLNQDGINPIFLRPWAHLTPESLLLKLVDLPDYKNISILEPLQACLSFKTWGEMEPSDEELGVWVVSRPDMSMSQLMDKLNTTDSKTRMRRTMASLSDKIEVQTLVSDFLKHLKESLELRLKKLPPYCKDCIQLLIRGDTDLNVSENRPCCSHAKVAVLYSGGVDSALLALLADLFVPDSDPIDLLNVAFERSRNPVDVKFGRRASSNGVFSVVQELTYLVPDRETGLQTLAELRTLAPNRVWNFVEINVTQDELKKEREQTIADLIHPLHTVLDDSLGCALWFASRGKGLLLANPKTPYTSPARIILSGIGADEQLGGYMRHRTTLKHKGGWPALDQELAIELGRIADRNLGRDDRITSSHGRQCRMPYLDENVVNFLSSLKSWQRCNPIDAMAPGLGDKILLRLAAWHVGLRSAANLPKRAIQFGSRIANSKEKGDAVSERL